MESKQKINGILLLLPALGEKPKIVFQKIKLQILLAEHGVFTIVPDLETALIADTGAITNLNALIETFIDKYDVKDLPVIVGGFSRGGAIALRFAEHLIASSSNLNLKAIFAIDPALDLNRLYSSSVSKIQYNCSNLIKKEGIFTKDYLEKKLGGPPDSMPENYISYSIYSVNVDSGGNARFLKNIPLRLYSEPDLDFVKKTYCKELIEKDINAYDLERLDHLLQTIGHGTCEYIITKARGFHSWNILDPNDCIDWILDILKSSSK